MDQNWDTLIDFSKLPSGIISGKEGHEIEAMVKNTLISNATPVVMNL